MGNRDLQSMPKEDNLNCRKPILVTGSHRSGSTWVGKMLSAAPGVAYIHEPFNCGIEISVAATPVPHWFHHFNADNTHEYYSVFGDVLQFRYPFWKNIAKAKRPRHLAKILRDQALFSYYKLNGSRPLVKDPLALFSAEWLSETYDMNVLVMIRHPAAFCSSIMKKNWSFEFSQFLDQPLLMDSYVHSFRKQIIEFSRAPKPIIEQAILLWNCIHCSIAVYQQKHPDWVFARHEDLSNDPVDQFGSLFSALGLEFNEGVKNTILKYSGDQNPVEQRPGKEFKRNSKANIKNWKNRLTEKEISVIKEKTSQYASVFYTEEDWC